MAPASRLSRLPPAVSRWLGYRTSPPPKRPDYIVYLWSFIGAFGGIALIQAVFMQAQYFVRRGVPSIVASYGASAVLIYGAVDAPLAQPRGLFGGHFLGALIGICITKLFRLLPTEERYEQLQWLAGSLACATSVVAMQITGTTHPPAGATALLAAVNTEIRELGWYYLPVVLLSSTLALAVALLTNNIQRRYPVFWFTPPAPPAPAVPAVSATPGYMLDTGNANANGNAVGKEKGTEALPVGGRGADKTVGNGDADTDAEKGMGGITGTARGGRYVPEVLKDGVGGGEGKAVYTEATATAVGTPDSASLL